MDGNGADLGGTDLGSGGDAAPAAPAAQPDGYSQEASPAPEASPQMQPEQPAQQPERRAQPRVQGRFAKPPEPPHAWKPEIRDRHWSTIPPELQGYINQRELEAHQQITRAGERLKSFEPLEQVLSSYKDDIARRGMQPAQAVAFLLNAQRQFDQNPMEAATKLLLTYGIDLTQFQPQGHQTQQMQQMHERGASLERALVDRTKELQAAREELAKVKADHDKEKRARDAANSARVNVRSSPAYPSPKSMDDTLHELARRTYG